MRIGISFELDPLEEYLAALHVLELGGTGEEAWRKFLQIADEMPGAPEKTKGFLLAVYDCCEAKGSKFKVPNFVLDEVSRRAGLDPASVGEARLRQRVKRLIANLGVPKVEDQIKAADALGQMGPAAVPALIGALKDSAADVRTRAADAF